MKEIIPHVDKELIKKELSADKFVKKTNALKNDIYVFEAKDAPNTMRELGRLRELAYRSSGAGTGKELDIDEYDTNPVHFKQLIVWNRETEEIISAYRYILGRNVKILPSGQPDTPVTHLFKFSDSFIKNTWNKCIELGRSFVNPHYQAGNMKRESLFAMDNMWDGLGWLIIDNPEIEYFIGRMSLYNNYDRKARELILQFLDTYYYGSRDIITPINPSTLGFTETAIHKKFTSEEEFKTEFTKLNKQILNLGTSIPPLIKTYMSLSPELMCFGITPNPDFGALEEICILIKINSIYDKKKQRHVALQ